MRLLLLAALWVHLACCVLLTGSFFMLLLAGFPRAAVARCWDARVLGWARVVVLVAIGSGIAWLLVRTATFENRPHAALEAGAVWHAALDTWPGFVWLARHGLLVVLAAFLAMRADVAERCNWVGARGEALLLAALALVLVSASGHAAATSAGVASAVAVDVVHLLATGLWLGALVPLALLLRTAIGNDTSESRAFAVRASRRFSHAALVVMVALAASGTLSAVVQVDNLGGLLGTTHGHLLLAKVTVLIPILGLAAFNRARVLPALSDPAAAPPPHMMRRLAAFVTMEAALALVVLALGAAMTLTTPARHAEPVWPLPFRLSPDVLPDAGASRWRALAGSQLALIGFAAMALSPLLRRRRIRWFAAAVVLVIAGAGLGLPPLVVHAYPTTYRRPTVTYHAGSIAAGMATYRAHCAACHGSVALPASRRLAGELFWILTHGDPDHGMPSFGATLTEAERWNAINYIRARAAADDARRIGRSVEPGTASVAAPDFTVAVGPLSPGALRDHRGRRMVLLVLYTLPGSRARMAELARSYSTLSILGVEVIAVPTRPSPDALRELGSSPPVLFPVVTERNADIAETYGLFAPGQHAEVLIDRQGYIRAIWSGSGEMPRSTEVQRQVEKLNEEKSPPPFPDDHVH